MINITLTKAQLLGLAGSALLLIGVFLPIMKIPIMGSIALFVGLKSYGFIVFLIALASLLAIYMDKIKFLLVSGLASLSIILYSLYGMNKAIEDMQSKTADLEGNVFGGFAAAMSQTASLEFGWIFLIVGSCLLIAASATKSDHSLSIHSEVTEVKRTKATASGVRGFLFFVFLLLVVIGIIIFFVFTGLKK